MLKITPFTKYVVVVNFADAPRETRVGSDGVAYRALTGSHLDPASPTPAGDQGATTVSADPGTARVALGIELGSTMPSGPGGGIVPFEPVPGNTVVHAATVSTIARTATHRRLLRIGGPEDQRPG